MCIRCEERGKHPDRARQMLQAVKERHTGHGKREGAWARKNLSCVCLLMSYAACEISLDRRMWTSLDGNCLSSFKKIIYTFCACFLQSSYSREIITDVFVRVWISRSDSANEWSAPSLTVQ
jgi:hypothetical protein